MSLHNAVHGYDSKGDHLEEVRSLPVDDISAEEELHVYTYSWHVDQLLTMFTAQAIINRHIPDLVSSAFLVNPIFYEFTFSY